MNFKKEFVMKLIKEEISFLLNTKSDSIFDICNLMNIKLIGHGRTTLVLNTNESDLYLVMTTDRKKKRIYENLSIGTKDFVNSSNKHINTLSKNIYMFYVEKLSLDSLDLNELNRAITMVESIIYADYNSIYDIKIIPSKFIKSKKEIIETLYFNDIFLDTKQDRILLQYIKDTFNSIYKISKEFKGMHMNIDLFEEQFLFKNGKLLCIDPFSI